MTLLPGIAESGHFALSLALCLALAQIGTSAAGAARGDAALMRAGRLAATAQFLAVAVAFAALSRSHASSDFSVVNVFANSHTLKPAFYKIVGVWGNHEGSLMLWALLLALFGAIVAWFGRSLPPRFKAWGLAAQGLTSIGFLAFILLTSNPFLRLFPMPAEGKGLNPLLQDPALALHPPLLYLGYVGFSVAFSFAIAALIEGRADAAWARWVRPWTLSSWIFLTAGIGLGSWWAYYELGWGGWWFWDPVENASLIPWLCGTALLHTAVVAEKRELLKLWTILLSILTFGAGLLGTFLVRSGVLTSVHAFASDPARGLFILLLLTFLIGGALTLFAVRAPCLKRDVGTFSPLSRESVLFLNTLIMTTAAATVLLGTLYPLIAESAGWGKVSVGPPFFEKTAIPLMIPALLALAIGPFLAWKRGNSKQAARLLLPVAVAAGIAAVLTWGWSESMGAALGTGLAAWIGLGALVELLERVQAFRAGPRAALRRAKALPRSAWGMTLAHLGVACLCIGISGSRFGKIEAVQNQRLGETVVVGSYQATLRAVEDGRGPNYRFVRAALVVEKNGRPFAVLYPERRLYDMPPTPTTEAAVSSSPLSDFYAVLGEPADAMPEVWTTRYYVEPFVSFLWYGILLMAGGGLLSLSDRRLRIGAAQRPRSAAFLSGASSSAAPPSPPPVPAEDASHV